MFETVNTMFRKKQNWDDQAEKADALNPQSCGTSSFNIAPVRYSPDILPFCPVEAPERKTKLPTTFDYTRLRLY